MEKKLSNEKTARILYLVVVGVLVLTALVIGLVAAFGKGKTPVPDEQPPAEETPSPDDTPTETPDETPDENVGVTVTEYLAPATGVVSKHHDLSVPVYSATMNDWRVHTGIDIATAEGADVLATAHGTVKSIYTDPFMGVCLELDHGNGVTSIYKNLSETMADGIAEGVTVTVGQKLGTVGGTAISEAADAAHLHFEMEYNGESADPLTYISEASYEASLSKDTAYES